MIGSAYGIQAYQKAIGRQTAIEGKVSQGLAKNQPKNGGFLDALQNSLKEVNEMEAEKSAQITAFASGKSENVHELMISLQKAGVAMSLTGAVRSKVLSAYQDLMRISF
ncbi:MULTISPECIES: flagellar hook-basal body complex protein FliE [Desulfovibrio]|jgi:flagellar hook-basal body complex protein FliE|uniref:flagellar hook-basal body complex protein FliE n=1 Tax=Desulfovibrio TaxID=872 RepID=UPI00042A3D21|nr:MULTISPECIES: flagellar hook-basal body complex protein FliE [Desulfovibrio]MDY0306978.1 flagellar hook-basal body complex protein FliE [Desulfovibrionaceae bacterium]HMM38957.1 flagellar hook-basal body complex protein FliE [Desulfovibrio sp.]